MGLCGRCGGPKTKKAGRYFRCRPCENERRRNSKKIREYNLKYKQEHRSHINKVEKSRRVTMRRKLLDYYGTICECCGENREEVLCIDHVDGGGREHRRALGIQGGTAFHKWLIDNDFPSGFRTLCHNCNQCTWAHGQCVHLGPSIKTGGPRYEYMKQRRMTIRMQALFHYSNGSLKCKQCGEDHTEFLSLDHINGGGHCHQKTVGRGSMFYKWIVTNDFPPGLQVLCHNCNFAKG